MKVFAYHNGSSGVSAYRVWNPMKYLARIEGMIVKRLPDKSDRVHIPWDGESNIPGIGSHDSITAQNDVIFSPFMAGYKDMIRLVCQSSLKPVVIDIDDDILNIDPSNPNYKAWHVNDGKKPMMAEISEAEKDSRDLKDKVRNMDVAITEKDGKWFVVGNEPNYVHNVIDELRNAALVTVSTEHLKELYSKWNDNIMVLPNGVDFEIWPDNNRKDDGLIRLGLFGSNTHFKDWGEIAETLKRILGEFPNVRLCYNSWFVVKQKTRQGEAMEDMEKTPQFPDFFDKLGLIEHPQVEIYEGVEIQKWPKALANVGIDIGLAPLANLTFNKAKSNLKYLEFSALRIPSVYEKMEPYQDDVKHGENGFLASHPKDWYSCIKRLIEDKELRVRMGNRARLDVEKRYDEKDIAQKLANILPELKSSNNRELSLAARAKQSGLILSH